MKNSIIIFSALVGLLFTSSCKDKNDDPAPTTAPSTTPAPTPTPTPTPSPSPATKTSLLTSKNWKLTSWTIDGKEQVTTATPECDKDDLTKYSAASSTATNGTYVVDRKTQCDGIEFENETGTWKLNTAQNIITQTNSLVTLDFTILELSVTKLKLQLGTMIFTYTAQ